MKLTRQHRREARLLWQAILVNGRPDADRIREAVRTVRQRAGRETEAVLRCFVQRLAVYIRSNQVSVISADPLSAARREQLSGLFRDMEKADSGIRFSEDPAVLGGLRIEKGYQVTDMTIARQLEILQNLLVKD